MSIVASTSKLSKLLLQLPVCLGKSLPLREQLPPFRVSHDTPLAALQLTVHIRLMQCDCAECHQMLGVRTWNIGKGLSIRPLGEDLEHTVVYVPEAKPRLSLTQSSNSIPELRHLLAFVGSEMVEYLQGLQYDEGTMKVLPRLHHVATLKLDSTSAEILPLEMRFNSSSLSFIYGVEKRKAVDA